MSWGIRTKGGYGDFGTLSTIYAKSRKGVPEESVDYILQMIGKKQPYILDIGCGTGISTRQLFEKGAPVAGTDVDAEMIQKAEMNNRYNIDYRVAPVEKQPFADGTFDAVTAFSAFHWFATTEALTEIGRVLKSGGHFFAVNKNESGDFKRNNKHILQMFVEKDMPDIKEQYAPRSAILEGICPARS